MSLIVATIMVTHGLIHLYGFFSEWFLKNAPQMCWNKIVHLSPRVSKVVGVVWLLVCFIFLASAMGLVFETQWWRISAAIGVIISQLLIIVYIKHAWFSTIGNILIIAAVLFLP